MLDIDRLHNSSVADWNQWYVNQTSGLDLAGADLSFRNLSNIYLFDADLRGANLAYADLTEADLSRANLEGAVLSHANANRALLLETNLTQAQLTKVNLRSATMLGARLRKSDLTDASLIGALLQNTQLQASNLCRADLSDTNLAYADLSDSELDGATFGTTTFCRTNLRNANGLESCKHSSPSALDFSSLGRVEALPAVFLRGCGLPDEMIDYLPSLIGNPISYYSCFISYSHEDLVFARRLHDQLQGRGIRCWLDEKQVLPGDDIYEQIDRGIRLWDKVLLCCSKSSLNSWWVDNEIETAFEKERQLMKEREKKTLALVPLNLDGYLFDEWDGAKKQQVKSRVAADFTGWETSNDQFENAFERLVDALKTDDAGREQPPEQKL